jgi:hypothetical protein
MHKLTAREYVMTGLLGVVAVLVFYYNQDTGFGRDSSSDAAGSGIELGEAPVVHLDRLASQIESYDPAGRDLFKYYTPPPPVRTIERPPPQPPPPVETRSVPVIRPTERANTGPRPPAISFTYLGYLGPKENRIAVFEDGQDVLLARAGEVVKDQFRVLDFGYETVTMGYVDQRFKDQTQELPQKAGAPVGRGRGRR